ncbi:MAG: hypothetical protein KatS3mg124_1964 [Porticoccaceae bacterium]|nr:MAG: hypothetical protein KatS3mg124_1964 [Porticoccaceae bacterium]
MLLGLLAALPARADDLLFQEARIALPPPGAGQAAGYLEVVSRAARPCRLTGAASDVAERVEFHRHLHHNGMMAMRPVAAVALPAGGRLSFAPGGLHLMLIGLRRPLAAGESVQIRLETDVCGSHLLSATVVDLRETSP